MKSKNLEAEEHVFAFAVGGEHAVAQARLGLVVCLCALPIFQLVRTRTFNPDLLIGFGAAGAALVVAFVFYLLARNTRLHPWLSYMTGVADVTLVSAVLLAFLGFGDPLVAANSRVLWALYLLAIGISALRPRRGIVVLVTLVAIGEYFAIALYADLRWNFIDPGFAAAGYGYFDWFAQISRMALMGAAGILAAVLVKRISYISRLAGTDSLTGAFNRTYFNMRLVEELQRAHRYRHPLTLAIVDIDHFKHINDTFGHDFGDKVLILIALRLKRGLRASDLLFRHGGDELAVLMPETSAQDAHQVLARIVRAVRKTRLKNHPLTVSIGTATWPNDARNGMALVRAADDNLYTAKDRGRDCIVSTAAARRPG
ncbi:MAG: diguanylate cyclase [Gammaproteobacteria bacterium]